MLAPAHDRRTIYAAGVWVAIAAAAFFPSHSRAAEIEAALDALAVVDQPATRGVEAAPGEELTAETVRARLEQVKAAAEPDDAARAKIVETYQQALTELERARSAAAQAAEFESQARQAPDLLVKIRSQLAAPASASKPLPPADATLAQLEASLAESQAGLAAAQKELTETEAEPKRRADRRLEIPKQIEQTTRQLDELRKQLSAPPGDNESGELVAARRMLLAARTAAFEAELTAFRRELESYDARNDLLPKRRDLAERQVAQQTKLVEGWQQIIHRRRQQEAAEKVRQATSERMRAYPELRELAAANEKLAQRATDVGNQITAASQQTAEFNNTLAELQRDFQGVTEKIDVFGLTQELGSFLLQHRLVLQQCRSRADKLRLPPSRIVDVRRQWMELLDERKQLGDLQARAREIVGQLDLSASRLSRQELENEVSQLLQSRREILDSLNSIYERYFRELAPLAFSERQLFDELDRQSDYLSERILWVRSTSAWSIADFPMAWDAAQWFVHPSSWVTAARDLLRQLTGAPVLTGAVVLVLAPLIAWQYKLRARIRVLGEEAARARTDTLKPTFQALVWTLLMAVPWPALLLFLSSQMGRVTEASDYVLAISAGLGKGGLLLFPLELLRQVCRRKGLAESHFGWPEASVRLLRKHLQWFMVLGLPLTFVAAALHAQSIERWRDSLSRLLFIAGMLLLAVFAERVLRPVGGVMHQFIAYRRGGWLDRLAWLWFPVAVGAPLVLAVLAALGYFFTARQLALRVEASVCLLAALMLVSALLLRWVLVTRRRLAIQQARQRRAAQGEARTADAALSPIPPSVEPELSLSTIDVQTRRLVQAGVVIGALVGVWLIWADVLPALSILNRPLWSVTVEVTENTTGVDGVETLQTVTQQRPVNVAHVILAALILAVTIFAGPNIPGLMEIALLQRLPLQPATRYAITTISRYLITALGVVMSCSALGIGWSKVQWLVAAISVGLGFGLQEIFANFVSGLVILFERPIRVGDIVTISDVSGVVSRIRIRATTITTWDRKELIVPNKEFITGRLLNWTLSDHVNRVEIKVGVAYGSDVGRVQSLLQKLASDHPHVLPDPAPIATFEGFGDSTLIFVLRCYLATLEHRLAVIHELHAGIHDTFRREQIEIAFPQRDLHLRTVPADPPDRKHPQANPPAPHFDFQPASSSNRSEFEILGRSMADEKSSLRGGK
jgi:potassium efflux system protein